MHSISFRCLVEMYALEDVFISINDISTQDFTEMLCLLGVILSLSKRH